MRFTLLAVLSLLSFVLEASAEEETVAYKWANTLTLESISNLQGGLQKGTRSLANLDLTLAIDTQTAGWWEGGTWFFYVLGDYGHNPSALTGESQTISNIETDVNDIKLYEFWYQHQFDQGKIKWLVGVHDFNSVFYSVDSAGLFSESSFGIGPEVAQVGPSIFPVTAFGSVLQYQDGIFYGLLGAYDGVPGDPEHPHGTHIKFNKQDGLFKTLELGVSEDKHYKLALGAWQHTAKVENPVDGEDMDSNHGVYLLGENYFSEDLVAFFQYGKTASSTNQLDQYMGTGVRVNNLWFKDDAAGLGYARVRNGQPFLQHNNELESAETVWELTYFYPLVEHVNLQSSVYYIENPGMQAELDNLLALGLRVYIDF